MKRDRSDDHLKSADGSAPLMGDSVSSTSGQPPRKRRKVIQACIYCRRSHMTCDQLRPCTRCIKRDIGHLCRDEPREPESKKAKPARRAPPVDKSEVQDSLADQASSSMRPQPPFDAGAAQVAKAAYPADALGGDSPLQLVQPTQDSGIQPSPLDSSGVNQFSGLPDAWWTSQDPFYDMHSYNPNISMAPEVHNEFNLLQDFLQSSLIDESAFGQDDQSPFIKGAQVDPALGGFLGGSSSLLPPSAMSGRLMLPPNTEHGEAIERPGSVAPIDKAREYYLQAADPDGNDAPEERMDRLLRAKYEAGLLKPFNYVNGYKRLHAYLDSHKVAPSSKQRIQRQLDKFRPKFREKMHQLRDMELVYVEMWFEKTLMEYDRVFASMAIPACCWRRTGEIVRGNKEMAELIHVAVERLRDGKVSLHEILTEESVVRYWEEFGTIAFDPAHDGLLTACELKNPDEDQAGLSVKCCFSLKIRRDDHKM